MGKTREYDAAHDTANAAFRTHLKKPQDTCYKSEDGRSAWDVGSGGDARRTDGRTDGRMDERHTFRASCGA
eukprot:6376386-Prymnesium_polylepis.1